MKLRSGFVSNSSSSSFIIGFNKRPDTVEELREMMFNELVEWDGDYLGTYPTTEIAEAIFDELTVQDPNEFGEVYGIVTREQAEKELDEYHDLFATSVAVHGSGPDNHGFMEDDIISVFGDDYESNIKYREWLEIWEEIDTLTDDMFEDRRARWDREWELKKRAMHLVNCLITEVRVDIFDAPVILLVEYEDHDDFGAFMEHSNVFKNLPYIRISKH
jgi:hypothetical protein